ncbi:enoyl-CoA hydratase/isomerase family protein [Alkalilacustris brevis]|uniref:enoyl-CoA hydratase/isomerase family protein n=1 Tax=Alkalilacustris brevis TaxID=2026338 RepID=UPI000E0DB335|nr:enoyl-CoA hydratase/isomerase family protein [Alkalilacustris brevis]
MNDDTLLSSTDARGICTLTLNRPALHNAFDDALIARLAQAFRALASDASVRVVVLAASGKSFSAGADLNWMRRMAGYSAEENAADARALADMLEAIATCPKPVIARVQGAAFGGGVGLVAACDIALASPRASFCLSEVRLGLIPAAISPHVAAAIGPRACRRYFLSAERFSAAEAHRLGLVHELAEDLDAATEALCDALLQGGPQALAQAKALIEAVAFRPIDGALLDDTAQRIAAIRVSPEGQEGLTAFLDKRKPSWTGG